MAPTPVREMTTAHSAIRDRHVDAALGPPKLSHTELLAAQRQTLDTPHMRYGMLARMLFTPVDLLYGKRGSFTS